MEVVAKVLKVKKGAQPMRTMQGTYMPPADAPKPRCPMHRVEMAFDPEKLRWGCPGGPAAYSKVVEPCNMVAYPDNTPLSGRAIVGKGTQEVIFAKDLGAWFIRCPENNVWVTLEGLLVETPTYYTHHDGTERIKFEIDTEAFYSIDSFGKRVP